MHKLSIIGLGVAAVVIVAGGIGYFEAAHGPAPEVTRLRTVASSFPVPPGATPAFPDSSAKHPLSQTRGWRSSGSLEQVCTSWRDAYRNWIGGGDVGSVSGEEIPGQSCSFKGAKSGYQATLQVAVYGSDPTPNVTLTVVGR